LEQLNKLKQAILKYEDQISLALNKDLNKSAYEAFSTEIGFCLSSLSAAMKKLKKWMKKKQVRTPIHQLFTKSYITFEPLGNVLIIGPYNYPFQLVIEPLIGAIAAGNTAIIKPSEFTSETEKVLKMMFDETFEKNYIYMFTGDYTVTAELIKLKFDHIFFTGSTTVGKIIYEAAAKHLTPVTLELGGKSPTIVDETANIEVAARRIAFGKFINAGQSCIAPDYIYVHEAIYDKFSLAIKKVIESMYKNKESFGRIVNNRHFDRLTKLIDVDKVLYGNETSKEQLYIGPTVLKDVTWDDPVMKDEIFGPILPLLKYQNIDDVIATLKQKEKPLALYLFTNRIDIEKKVFNSLSFGGGAINDTIMHITNPNLPFGGVGSSGIGYYHGKSSFEVFSNTKAYVKKGTFADPSFAYPPHTKAKENLLRRIFK